MDRRTQLVQRHADRSSSKAWTLRTGSPLGVSLVSALAVALPETSALSAGELRCNRAPAREFGPTGPPRRSRQSLSPSDGKFRHRGRVPGRLPSKHSALRNEIRAACA